MIIMLALCLWIAPAMTVRAEDGNVIYDGDAREFIFEPGSQYSPTDLFAEFKDVMPGDQLTQRIHVKNDASHKVKVKIYMRVLGAHEESKAFLSQLNMLIRVVDSPSAYMFLGTAAEKAQMADWVCLGTLYSGGAVDLDVILDVPVELDNTYSSQIGYLDWEFKVEEFPIESSDPQAPESTPDTGDMARPALWGGLAATSGVCLYLLGKSKKKEGEA